MGRRNAPPIAQALAAEKWEPYLGRHRADDPAPRTITEAQHWRLIDLCTAHGHRGHFDAARWFHRLCGWYPEYMLGTGWLSAVQAGQLIEAIETQGGERT